MSNNDGVGPGGKGDKPRPTDKKKYDEGYDRIFNNKNKEENTMDEAAIKRARATLEKCGLLEEFDSMNVEQLTELASHLDKRIAEVQASK